MRLSSLKLPAHCWMPSLQTLALLAVVLSAGNVSAQDSHCKAKLNDLPQAAELSGLRLGMTMDQIKARVPQVVFGRTDEVGTSKTTINPYFDSRIDKAIFPDVRTVSLDFFDGRLTSLWIGYDPTFKWPTVEDFVKGISTTLSLPHSWSSWKSRGQRLRCADFEMTVTSVAGGPSFRILDMTAEEALTARRAEHEEEKSALEAAEEGAEETELIVADKNTKIYYPSDCRPAKEISAANRVVFKTADEAEKAGFKLTRDCP